LGDTGRGLLAQPRTASDAADFPSRGLSVTPSCIRMRRRTPCFPSRSRAALQCLDRSESGAAHWVHRVLLQPWSSRTWLLESPLESRRRCPSRAPRPSTPGLPTFHRVLPGFPGRRERSRDRSGPAPSLSWGLVPYSDHDCKGAASPGGSHPPARCVFRLRTSLDAFLPFAASDRFGSGRSWDSPFRAFLLQARRRVLSDRRALLTLLVPTPPR